MTKNKQIIERVIVTFGEAVISYLSVNQTNLTGNAKTVAIGAAGFGLSAAYNVLRQSTPTVPTPSTDKTAAKNTFIPGAQSTTSVTVPSDGTTNIVTDPDTILADLEKEEEPAPPTPQTV
jgi:hypothetical protein